MSIDVFLSRSTKRNWNTLTKTKLKCKPLKWNKLIPQQWSIIGVMDSSLWKQLSVLLKYAFLFFVKQEHFPFGPWQKNFYVCFPMKTNECSWGTGSYFSVKMFTGQRESVFRANCVIKSSNTLYFTNHLPRNHFRMAFGTNLSWLQYNSTNELFNLHGLSFKGNDKLGTLRFGLLFIVSPSECKYKEAITIVQHENN